ncbi:ribosomal prt S19 [Enterospora canceri]|uniref:Ribosomal prt S19 n=1 Tax=Enterospora canceri TaxID=1081671 RepID=A0A1Y1S528_9MICR|nr:ribosomal prt S19 [Enterospora canceri]
MIGDLAYRVNPHKLVEEIALMLEKEKIEMPVDADLIKTGSGRQYSPMQSNWFLLRTASVLRQAAIKNGISLNGLAYRYGNRKNRGVRPTKFARGSRYVIEMAVENLVKLGWIDFKQKDGIVTEKAEGVLKKCIEQVRSC